MGHGFRLLLWMVPVVRVMWHYSGIIVTITSVITTSGKVDCGMTASATVVCGDVVVVIITSVFTASGKVDCGMTVGYCDV